MFYRYFFAPSWYFNVRGNIPLLICVPNREWQSFVVKNGNDSLDICRVVNGMWQTSGGWGRADRDDAVDAMLKYVDAGLATFDMADICMQLSCFYLLYVWTILMYPFKEIPWLNSELKLFVRGIESDNWFVMFKFECLMWLLDLSDVNSSQHVLHFTNLLKGYDLWPFRIVFSFLCSSGFADGPAEDLYGIFINRVRRERPAELLEQVRGWVDYMTTYSFLNCFFYLKKMQLLWMGIWLVASYHNTIYF